MSGSIDNTRLIVDVTYLDIMQGIPKNPNFCPIALAVLRALKPAARYVGVGSDLLEIGENDNPLFIVPLPEEAKEFVEKFDAGQPVKSFSFEVNLTTNGD